MTKQIRKVARPVAELLAEYSEFPKDQPVNEQYTAARLGKSRALLQLRRCTGGGPKFYRTDTGKIFYIKRDVEAYLAASMTAHNSTAEYKENRAAA